MNKMKRFLVVLISSLVCFLLQTLAFSGIPYLNAVPNLILIEVLSTGFLFGRGYGLAAGFVNGLVFDLVCSGTPGFYALLFMWLGFLNGLLSEKLESEQIFLLYLLLIANELVYHVYTFGLSFLIRKSFSFMSYVTSVFIPELLLTMVCFLLVYGILIFLAKRWDLKINKGEVKVV